jgi:arsenite/tail-anchored protein-transporting ATPase
LFELGAKMDTFDLTKNATRHLFFTGKGGVGKTSISCAVAIALADRGKNVLLVSTDPASNLDEVLGVKLKGTASPVPGVERLAALNIDPEEAAAAYRERMVAPYRGVLPAATLASMEEQLSGSCTMEIAAFDEFSALIGDPANTSAYDHVVFDTAPTGHTLRLLSLPGAWTSFIETNTTGTSCLGPLAGLEKQQKLYQGSVKALSDAALTTVILVSRPERAALREAERTSKELHDIGVANQYLILNGVLQAGDPSDRVAVAFQQRQQEALKELPSGIAALPRQEISLSPQSLLGAESLRSWLSGRQEAAPARAATASAVPDLSLLSDLVDELERAGKGVIMTMGKGGVGKTTIAASIALALCQRGHRVHLSTTDPAAHVSWVVSSLPAGLTVSEIDAEKEIEAYTDEVMNEAGKDLDAQGRALLAEDLRSPCTEEVAVFRKFAETVAGGTHGFVVLDTAPTGHTILLLDAAEAYHREVLRQSSNMPDTVRELLPRLRDSNYTRILLVTLPEATPVHEAARLQSDLARAEIQPFAWVINQSFTPVTTSDPVLSSRKYNESTYINEVGRLGKRVILVPWLMQTPTGGTGLSAMLAGAAETSPQLI